MSKKIKLIAIVVVAIVIIAIGATLVWYLLRGKPELYYISVEKELEPGGVSVSVLTRPPEFSGVAKLRISYRRATLYATISGGATGYENVSRIQCLPDCDCSKHLAGLHDTDGVWGGGYKTYAGPITEVVIGARGNSSVTSVSDKWVLKYSLDGGVTFGQTTNTFCPTVNVTDWTANVTADRTWSWTDISNLRVYCGYDRVDEPDTFVGWIDSLYVIVGFEATTYPERDLEISNGKGTLFIPYNEFVLGNGEYSIQAEFGNKTSRTKFDMYGVVEDIKVFVTRIYHEGSQPKFELEVWPSPVAFVDTQIIVDTRAKVTITKLDDGTLLTENRNIPFEMRGKYKDTISYTRSGYYRINAELTNYVKADSPYLRVTKECTELINLAPIITEKPEDATVYNTPRENGTLIGVGKYESDGWTRFVRKDLLTEEAKNYEITYRVIDYDDDLSSLTVLWDVGYNQTQGKPVKSPSKENGTNDTVGGLNNFDAWYQYPVDNDPGEGGPYTVSLTIYDRWWDLDYAACKVIIISA
ncbi:MAG: hypothetical protein AB1485_01475 [Candidatus Thermoplasmatota archaeon]